MLFICHLLTQATIAELDNLTVSLKGIYDNYMIKANRSYSHIGHIFGRLVKDNLENLKLKDKDHYR